MTTNTVKSDGVGIIDGHGRLRYSTSSLVTVNWLEISPIAEKMTQPVHD